MGVGCKLSADCKNIVNSLSPTLIRGVVVVSLFSVDAVNIDAVNIDATNIDAVNIDAMKQRFWSDYDASRNNPRCGFTACPRRSAQGIIVC